MICSGSAEYKLYMTGVMLGDALEQASVILE